MANAFVANLDKRMFAIPERMFGSTRKIFRLKRMQIRPGARDV